MKMAVKQYTESVNTRTEWYPNDITVLSTPDNLWLYTENDNLLTDELWNPLCIY